MYLGTCLGMVVRTGDRTVMGRIANLASSKEKSKKMTNDLV